MNLSFLEGTKNPAPLSGTFGFFKPFFEKTELRLVLASVRDECHSSSSFDGESELFLLFEAHSSVIARHDASEDGKVTAEQVQVFVVYKDRHFWALGFLNFNFFGHK